jgi:putative ABC transport system permease protein
MRALLRRVWYFVRQRRLDADLAEEMDFHRAMATEDLERGGTDAGDARLAARRTFGSAALAQDRARDVWVPRAFQGLVQDFRLAARLLWKARLVSTVALISLALGIGANTAIFSLVNSLLLRALPVHDPGRVAMLVEPVRPSATDDFSGVPVRVRYAVWDQIRQRSVLFAGAAVWSSETFDLGAGADTEPVDGLIVNGAFFDVLGVRAAAGRTLADTDDGSVAGGDPPPAAVISHSLWQRRFGGSRDAIGRSIRLDAVVFTIVGVTPAEFFGPEVGRRFDVMVPLGTEPRLHGSESWLTRRSLSSPLMLLARLRPDQTAEAASLALRGIQAEIAAATLPPEYPAQFRNEYLKDPFTLVPVSAASTNLRRRYSRPLLTLMAVVALVLLVACGNVANLLLARATARRHELSVRRALGASRWRLIRQMLAESALLAVIAAALGIAIATVASQVLVQQLSSEANPVFLDLSINARVMAFTAGVSMLTVVLFGVLPAVRASAIVPADALNTRTGSGAGTARGGVANSLVVVQLTLSLVLVATSGLLVRTFSSLAGLDLGFDAGRVLVVRMNARQAVMQPSERPAIYERIRAAVAAVPGVAAAAVSAQTPIVTGPMFAQPIKEISGAPPLPRGALARLNLISPDWFETLGTPLVGGRDVSTRDARGSAAVAIVNQEFARKFLNGANPIARTVTLYLPGPPLVVEIVGVARDAVYGTLRNPSLPTMYEPISQLDDRVLRFIASVYLTVRSKSGPPAALARSVAAAIADVNPNIGLSVHPLTDELDASLTQERVVAILSGFFGAIALLLAALGLYGVTSYAVTRRRTEIGIRMALGATRGSIVAHVLRRVSVLVASGLGIGVVAGLWASRFIEALLYGLKPRDPATFAGAAAVLAFIAFAAAWLPARRAARIDPAIALREE